MSFYFTPPSLTASSPPWQKKWPACCIWLFCFVFLGGTLASNIFSSKWRLQSRGPLPPGQGLGVMARWHQASPLTPCLVVLAISAVSALPIMGISILQTQSLGDKLLQEVAEQQFNVAKHVQLQWSCQLTFKRCDHFFFFILMTHLTTQALETIPSWDSSFYEGFHSWNSHLKLVFFPV